MEEKQYKFKFFLTVFLAAAAILAFWFFISLPLIKNAEKLNRDFELSRELLAALNQKEARFAELKNLGQEVESEFPALAEMVLSEKNILDFVVSLENLARLSKVVLTIDSLPSALPGQGGSFRVLPFRLNVWGSFPNFYQFFRSLENFDFWVNIEEIKIAKLNNFTLPAGPRFGNLTTDDVSAIINLGAFFSD